MQGKMRSLLIVEGNVAPDSTSVRPKIFRDAPQTFLLESPVETFKMSIVIGSAHPAEPMGARSLPEGRLEFWPVVTLEHLEREGRRSLGLSQEGQAAARVDTIRHFSECPPRMHIKQRVDVESLPRDGMDVDGIHLHQITRRSRIWSARTFEGLPPWTAALEESMPLERPLHGAQADLHSILLQEMMNDLAASSVLLPAPENRSDDVIGELFWMMMRT